MFFPKIITFTTSDNKKTKHFNLGSFVVWGRFKKVAEFHLQDFHHTYFDSKKDISSYKFTIIFQIIYTIYFQTIKVYELEKVN